MVVLRAGIREVQRVGSRVLAIKDPVVVRRVMALIDTLAVGEGGGYLLAASEEAN